MIDISRLNDAELRVLRLLAEGHTAKSIANALESTPAAVNERLREARRKTGVGSSRELARLLKSQENCDDQIGVGKAVPIGPVGDAGVASARSNGKVTIAMTGLLLTGAVATAIGLHAPTPNAPAAAEPFSDPLVGNIFEPADPQKKALIPTTERDYAHGRAGETDDIEAAMRQLHAQVRIGPRDQDAETRLAAIYKSMHPIKLSAAPLRVICSGTVCEVATVTDVPTPQAAIDATLGEVQGAELRQRVETMGLKPLYLWFGHHPSEQRAAYLGYWARK